MSGMHTVGARQRRCNSKEKESCWCELDLWLQPGNWPDFIHWLWSYEDPQDPSCVKSRTGFVIQITGCPLLWASRLQQEIALSTMQAEYTAMSMAMRDLLPFQRLAFDVCRATGLDKTTVSTIHSTVWEDDGALTLAKLPINHVTPRSSNQHYAVKLHWFRSQLWSGAIGIKRVATDEQLADILTKGLRAEKCTRFKLMGW